MLILNDPSIGCWNNLRWGSSWKRTIDWYNNIRKCPMVCWEIEFLPADGQLFHDVTLRKNIMKPEDAFITVAENWWFCASCGGAVQRSQWKVSTELERICIEVNGRNTKMSSTHSQSGCRAHYKRDVSLNAHSYHVDNVRTVKLTIC